MPIFVRPLSRGVLSRLVALCLALWPAIALADGAPRLPVLGADPLSSGTIVESHADALLHWSEAGFKKATLLHVDTHHGLLPSGAAHVKDLAALAARGELTEAKMSRLKVHDGLFDEFDFVRAAQGLGIVSKVYWIVPVPVLGPMSPDSRFGPFLEDSGLTTSDLAGFSYREGCYAGTYGGVPLTICGQESLPAIDEPVLLSLDVDYFVAASEIRKKPFLDEIGDFFKKAAPKKYKVADALLAYSLEGSYVSAQNRWVGDALLDYLSSPGLIFQPTPAPDLSILQKASDLADKDRYAEVEASTRDYLSHFPTKSPSMLFTLAYSQLMLGRTAPALASATQACQGDPGYCYGLLELGLIMVKAGELKGSEPFFETAERLNPAISYGDFSLGLAYLKVRDYDRTLAVFEKLKSANPGSYYDFALGAVQLEKGDEASAAASFDRGVANVEKTGEHAYRLRPDERKLIGAIRIAMDYYQKKGMPQKAALLEKYFRLQPPNPDQSR